MRVETGAVWGGAQVVVVYTNWAGSIALRYDSSAGAFDDRDAWECVCIATIAATALQYQLDRGTLLPSEATTVSSFFAGDVTYDGRRYVYFAPARAAESPLVRWDTRGGLRDPARWEAVDLTTHSAAVESAEWRLFGGIASDGRYLYTVPNDYLAGAVYTEVLPNSEQNVYAGTLFRIDPQTDTPAFELSVASGGGGGGGGAGNSRGVVWSVSAGAGVASIASGVLLSAGVRPETPTCLSHCLSTQRLSAGGVLCGSGARDRRVIHAAARGSTRRRHADALH